MEPEIRVDPAEARSAVLYVRDEEGRDWLLGALLSDLQLIGSDSEEARAICDDEQLSLLAFHVVKKEG